jgi:hypothetical protein
MARQSGFCPLGCKQKRAMAGLIPQDQGLAVDGTVTMETICERTWGESPTN